MNAYDGVTKSNLQIQIETRQTVRKKKKMSQDQKYRCGLCGKTIDSIRRLLKEEDPRNFVGFAYQFKCDACYHKQIRNVHLIKTTIKTTTN